MTTGSINNRRSWLVIMFGSKPNRWGRILILFFAAVAVQSLVCMQIFRNAMAQIQLLDIPRPEAALEVISTLSYLVWFFVLTIVALCSVCMYLIYYITVNVYGAKRAVLDYIQILKSGSYEPFRKLRADDEFQDVVSSLEDLADRLKRESKG